MAGEGEERRKLGAGGLWRVGGRARREPQLGCSVRTVEQDHFFRIARLTAKFMTTDARGLVQQGG